MEKARRARRHLRRAHELLGFGVNESNVDEPSTSQRETGDGETGPDKYPPKTKREGFDFMDLPTDMLEELFHRLDGTSLYKLLITAKKGDVNDYLQTLADDPRKLKEVADKRDKKLLRLVLMRGSEECKKIAEGEIDLVEEVKNNNHEKVLLILILWGVTNELIDFIPKKWTILLDKNEAMKNTLDKNWTN